MAELQVVDITAGDANPDLLDAVYDEVLRPSFSRDELPSLDTVTEGFDIERFHLVRVATTPDGQPVGAAVYSDDGVAVGILSYLATRPGGRDRGTGALLLAHLRPLWSARPVQVVVGEVHDPRFYPETDADRAVSRVRFYQRCGTRLLDVPWLQPRLSPQGARVPNMVLLAFYLDEAAEARGGVDCSLLAAFAERYYVDQEGEVPDDAGYRALQARLTEHPMVRARPLAELDELVPLAIP